MQDENTHQDNGQNVTSPTLQSTFNQKKNIVQLPVNQEINAISLRNKIEKTNLFINSLLQLENHKNDYEKVNMKENDCSVIENSDKDLDDVGFTITEFIPVSEKSMINDLFSSSDEDMEISSKIQEASFKIQELKLENNELEREKNELERENQILKFGSKVLTIEHEALKLQKNQILRFGSNIIAEKICFSEQKIQNNDSNIENKALFVNDLEVQALEKNNLAHPMNINIKQKNMKLIHITKPEVSDHFEKMKESTNKKITLEKEIQADPIKIDLKNENNQLTNELQIEKVKRNVENDKNLINVKLTNENIVSKNEITAGNHVMKNSEFRNEKINSDLKYNTILQQNEVMIENITIEKRIHQIEIEKLNKIEQIYVDEKNDKKSEILTNEKKIIEFENLHETIEEEKKTEPINVFEQKQNLDENINEKISFENQNETKIIEANNVTINEMTEPTIEKCVIENQKTLVTKTIDQNIYHENKNQSESIIIHTSENETIKKIFEFKMEKCALEKNENQRKSMIQNETEKTFQIIVPTKKKPIFEQNQNIPMNNTTAITNLETMNEKITFIAKPVNIDIKNGIVNKKITKQANEKIVFENEIMKIEPQNETKMDGIEQIMKIDIKSQPIIINSKKIEIVPKNKNIENEKNLDEKAFQIINSYVKVNIINGSLNSAQLTSETKIPKLEKLTNVENTMEQLQGAIRRSVRIRKIISQDGKKLNVMERAVRRKVNLIEGDIDASEESETNNDKKNRNGKRQIKNHDDLKETKKRRKLSKPSSTNEMTWHKAKSTKSYTETPRRSKRLASSSMEDEDESDSSSMEVEHESDSSYIEDEDKSEIEEIQNEKNQYRPGTVVECLYKNLGEAFVCTLVHKTKSGWTVKWEDGDTQNTKGHPKSHITRIIDAPDLEKKSPFVIGTIAECQYGPDLVYKCTLVEKTDEGLWTVQWLDGDIKNKRGHSEEDFIKIIQIGASDVTNPFRVGTIAQCLFNEDGHSYKCMLVKKEIDGTWTIEWEDGDGEDTIGHPETDFTKIIKIGTKEFNPYQVGAVVKCLHGKKRDELDAYECSLIKKDRNGKWKVKWHDGDTNDTTGHSESDFVKIIKNAHEILQEEIEVLHEMKEDTFEVEREIEFCEEEITQYRIFDALRRSSRVRKNKLEDYIHQKEKLIEKKKKLTLERKKLFSYHKKKLQKMVW